MNTPESPMSLMDVAALAKLSVAPEEAPAIQRDLDELLAFAAQMQSLDLAGVQPTAHIVPVTDVLRPDAPHTPLARDVMLRNAPTCDGTFITVPAAIRAGEVEA